MALILKTNMHNKSTLNLNTFKKGKLHDRSNTIMLYPSTKLTVYEVRYNSTDWTLCRTYLLIINITQQCNCIYYGTHYGKLLV